jgi:hypothetical protein
MFCGASPSRASTPVGGAWSCTYSKRLELHPVSTLRHRYAVTTHTAKSAQLNCRLAAVTVALRATFLGRAHHRAPRRRATPLQLHADPVASARHQRRHPQREPRAHEPHTLEQHGRRPHHGHGEAPWKQDGGGGEGARHHELQQQSS